MLAVLVVLYNTQKIKTVKNTSRLLGSNTKLGKRSNNKKSFHKLRLLLLPVILLYQPLELAARALHCILYLQQRVMRYN